MSEWIEVNMPFVWTILGTILTFFGYSVKVTQRAKSNTRRIDSIENDIKEMRKDINDIENAQIKTDQKLQTLIEGQDKMILLLQDKK